MLKQGLAASARQLRRLVTGPGFRRLHPADQERMAKNIYAANQRHAKAVVTRQPAFMRRYHTAWRKEREAQVAGG